MNTTQEITLGELRLGGTAPLFLIAGPCVIESAAHAQRMAERVAKVAADAGVPYIFKASYDKANRSSMAAYRGPGVGPGKKSLAILVLIQDTARTLTDAEIEGTVATLFRVLHERFGATLRNQGSKP